MATVSSGGNYKQYIINKNNIDDKNESVKRLSSSEDDHTTQSKIYAMAMKTKVVKGKLIYCIRKCARALEIRAKIRT